MNSTDVRYLPYSLTLRAPAIATALSSDPNSAATQPFIPGGAIRGAVAARLLAAGEVAESPVFRKLVLSGVVRYLHAYPEVGGNRGMPTPQSWRESKAQPGHTHDLASFCEPISQRHKPDEFGDLWPDVALVALGAPFTAPYSSQFQSVSGPRMQGRVHQQRDRVKGRPWTELAGKQEVPRGAIFAYESLEPGQVFHGVVQIRQSRELAVEGEGLDEYVARLSELLHGKPILIGRSRRAGYGGAAEMRVATKVTTQEYPSVNGAISNDLEGGTCYRMLLLSAYIGRHPVTGQNDPEALAQELRERGLQAVVERRCWSFETVGSFNRKWRLEVPQATAVAAGSVLVLRAQSATGLALLRSIEDDGLGERRVEGFGRVRFLEHDDRPSSFQIRRDDEKAPSAPTQAQRLTGASTTQLAFLEQRIVLAAAHRSLDRAAARLVRGFAQGSSLPTTSLLGRIRTVLRAVRDDASALSALGVLRAWCSEEGADALRPQARKKLQACRHGETTLLQWLKTLTPEPDAVMGWTLVMRAAHEPSLNSLAQVHHLTSTEAAERVLEGHAVTLAVHLVDAVLAGMARYNRGTKS